MSRLLCKLSAMTAIALTSAGCMNGVIGPIGGDAAAVSEVAARALDVASEIGGAEGFGGSLMDGYLGHMPSQMGFRGTDDLAPEETNMTVAIRNESSQGGTFHLSYFAHYLGLEDQMMDVDVPAGETVTVEIPCSEVVGMGALDAPGDPGCHLDDGEVVSNIMATPGFFGEDFTCDDIYECSLIQDVNDLDGDGDTEELILLSDAMDFHMGSDGPMGHGHGQDDDDHGPMHP